MEESNVTNFEFSKMFHFWESPCITRPYNKLTPTISRYKGTAPIPIENIDTLISPQGYSEEQRERERGERDFFKNVIII